MKKLSETLTELGISFSFPIEIRDADGNETYREDIDGYCYKYEWDAKGNATYYENSNDYCRKWERDAKGNETYYEDSDGITRGTPHSAKTCEGKQMTELMKDKAYIRGAECHEEGGEIFVTDQSGNGNHAKLKQ
jgi:hypothetical protein